MVNERSLRCLVPMATANCNCASMQCAWPFRSLGIAVQLEMLRHIFAEMQKEYGVRRQMLIERAKVTLESMLWSKELLDSRGTTEQAAAAAEHGKVPPQSPTTGIDEVQGQVEGDHFGKS